ncbi:hypothetical protein BpOF4_15975 [Alkalihalophilus pseudofirmus OF4]|uniref:DUF1538 domain-containing protein n=1 Tax=Alkalihalophilus pseudofirmus (strain ATCC BAA-2126 / JCM 17055 / OF4) TaxID=398511 RepID=D3G0T2_ALKPO|nr:DUF1538 domain-containing protein [Alkalihalophilus pseudofirmus]ADC51244.1 hypothetical protein BpOF4_15975 [Alkalihalophilus pseudofirmus OF4]WEG18447.1 DUF1538 domain-containing protein [Alkalihalophilus pseudofirmus]
MNITIFEGFTEVLVEVFFALLPLLVFFLVFQFFFLKLEKEKIINIGKGMVLSFFGLALFLQGVHVGFFPAGELMGEVLGGLSYNWILIPIGFVLGFVATFAEPAVRILNEQVEKVSGGYISERVMLYTLSIGVGVSIALSMLRILVGFSLWYYIIPGYILAVILLFLSSNTFSAIAFDSGGVATGPMTVTFILAIAVGVASVTEGRDPLMDGFGMIALVALAPILSVLILGVLFERQGRESNET